MVSDYEFADNDIEYSWSKGPALKGKKEYVVGQNCPKCNRTMVKRQNSRTGEFFYGCTGYPACQHSMPISASEALGIEKKPEVVSESKATSRWIEVMDTQGYTLDYKCPHCNHHTMLQSNYCPDCGKKLERVKI